MLPKERFRDFEIRRQPSYTYRLDVDRNKISGYTDGRRAVAQTIYKILNTERYQYPIYSANYGIELMELIGKPMSWVIPEAQRRIEEALLSDNRITRLTDFTFEPGRNKLHISFIAHTFYGELGIDKEVTL